MHITLSLLLLIIAFALFIASAVGVPSRVNLTSAGLACWVLSIILTGVG